MSNRLSTPEKTAQLVHSFAAHTAQPQPSLFSLAELPARLWTLKEVAEYLQMSKDWVRDHATRRQPRIPSIRLGGRRKVLRFRPQDVRQFINDHLSEEQPR
jgi:predicted DNA-binding transcriptional regulator AlpA